MRWHLPLIGLAAVACAGKIELESPPRDYGSAGSSGASGQGSAGLGGSSGAAGDPGKVSCELHSDCVLMPRSCCGSCGAPTPEDMVALPATDVAGYRSLVCQGIDCPPCANETIPTLLASCVAGQCVATNLLVSPITACRYPEDCQLRANECCECGAEIAPSTLVAIASSQSRAYESLLCASNQPCDDCIPDYPPLNPQCIEGHCAIVWLGD